MLQMFKKNGETSHCVRTLVATNEGTIASRMEIDGLLRKFRSGDRL